MAFGSVRFRFLAVAAWSSTLGATFLAAQQEQHGRNYKPLPPMVRVQVTVLKDFNGKPFPNAGVVFHAVRNGKNDGNLEVKTDPDGRASIDVIEQGSHVTLQIIARGYATYATEFDADAEEKEFTVRLQRPRAQVSVYEENEGKAAQVKPGVQERHLSKPAAAPPKAPSAPSSQSTPPASPTAPLETTPVANTPAGPATAPAGTGKPQ